MKEQIKLALLGVIALTLIVNTYFQIQDNNASSHSHAESAIASTPKSNVVATSRDNDPLSTFDPLKKAQEQKKDLGPPTKIEFANYEHDFGTIKQNTENKHVFTFTNTGDKPLVISDAKGSCGCTVPNYPKQPIPPGQTGDIEVVYKPGKQKATQNKTVTITANTEPSQTVLRISANVEEEES